MLHLRIVAPSDPARRAIGLPCASSSVVNVVHLHGAAQRPAGDVILCDVAREDASVIIPDVIDEVGSIAVETIDTAIFDAFDKAERAASGMPSDAVVWEEVEARTSETTELSGSYIASMVLANLGAILLAGTLTLAVQKALYNRHRAVHMRDPAGRAAGLRPGSTTPRASSEPVPPPRS